MYATTHNPLQLDLALLGSFLAKESSLSKEELLHEVKGSVSEGTILKIQVIEFDRIYKDEYGSIYLL